MAVDARGDAALRVAEDLPDRLVVGAEGNQHSGRRMAEAVVAQIRWAGSFPRRTAMGCLDGRGSVLQP